LDRTVAVTLAEIMADTGHYRIDSATVRTHPMDEFSDNCTCAESCDGDLRRVSAETLR
jgi:hypothetical protein